MNVNNKKLILILLAGLLASQLVACKKKEEVPLAEKAVDPHMQMQGHDMMKGTSPAPAAPKELAIPDEVRAAWKPVSIAVKNKENGEVKSYEVKPESEFAVPATNIVLKVGAYLPDFTMSGAQITSRSSESNNPALQVTILEDNVEKYKGWLFSNFPDMHAFEHPKYGVTLGITGTVPAAPAPVSSHSAK
ncbi:MAG: DUF2155 domain-containing protein [Candidatus Schekmanbacteria bacterium]|nr:DUF2155 domain-containing protein [Candidatus Schekmanbacteria bacterium]